MPSAATLASGRSSRFAGRDESALVVGGRTIFEREYVEIEALAGHER